MAETGIHKIATNRKAFRDYEILERVEAGIELRGTEVKSARNGKVRLDGGYARVDGRDIHLVDTRIEPYDHGNQFNHAPDRARRLLLHRSEIRRLAAHTDRQGHTLIPLSMYFKRGMLKVELGICRGKAGRDKRDDMKKKTADRETARAMANHRRQ